MANPDFLDVLGDEMGRVYAACHDIAQEAFFIDHFQPVIFIADHLQPLPFFQVHNYIGTDTSTDPERCIGFRLTESFGSFHDADINSARIIKHFALCRRELVHEIHRNVNIGSDLDADRIICRDG